MLRIFGLYIDDDILVCFGEEVSVEKLETEVLSRFALIQHDLREFVRVFHMPKRLVGSSDSTLRIRHIQHGNTWLHPLPL